MWPTLETLWLARSHPIPRKPRPRRCPDFRRLLLERLEDRSVPSISPIDVVGRLPAAEYNQFIANAVTSQGTPYKDWGNEPSVAVNSLNPNQIVVSSFAYSNFIQTPRGDARNSIWYSTDGGSNWGIRFPILSQTPASGQLVPADQTIAYDSNGVLHGAFLTYNPSGGPASNIFHGTTTDPNADGLNGRPDTVWHWGPSPVNLDPRSANTADQPWLALGNGHAYVGYGVFDGNSEVRVSTSADNGATFTTDNNINSTNNNGNLSFASNSGIRLATDRIGNVYSIYGWGETPTPKPGSGEATRLHYRLNMSSDGGQTWKFTSLGGQAGGLVIDDGLSLQLGSSFGGVNRLTGNITALAADSTGAHIYALYGKEDGAGMDRLYLAEFHPDGSGGLVERASPLPLSVPGQRSALPSVAVTDNETIAVQYDTFTDADGQFHVHLATSTDQGQTFADQDLYDFTATGIPGGNRLLGDYQGLIALGNSVYGTFAARGNVRIPDQGIDSTDKIDPFFYSVALPGGGLSSLAPSLGGGSAASLAGGATGASATGAGGDASNALVPLSLALEPAAPVWLGPAAVSSNGPGTVSAGVQVLPLRGNVATVDQVFAVNGWEGQDRNLSLIGRTRQPLDWGSRGDEWPTEDVLLDTKLSESGLAG
jgi:hypothetical protein